MDNAVTKFTPEQIGTMAKRLVESRLFPGIKTEAQAYTLMMLADADGVHPMKVGFRYDILPSGKPSMKGEAMLAEFMARGGTVDWLKLEDDVCEAIFYSPGVPKGVKIRWTIEDAQRARLIGKDNWKMYSRQMLKWRTVTDGVKTALPAAGQGLYPTEVAQDFDEPKTVKIEAEVIEAPASEHEPPVDEAPPPSEPPAGGELFGAAGGLQEGESGSIGAAPPADDPPPPEKKVTDGVEMGDLLFKMAKQLDESHPFCKCGDVMVAKLDTKRVPYGACRVIVDARAAGTAHKDIMKQHDFCRLRKPVDMEGPVPF